MNGLRVVMLSTEQLLIFSYSTITMLFTAHLDEHTQVLRGVLQVSCYFVPLLFMQ